MNGEVGGENQKSADNVTHPTCPINQHTAYGELLLQYENTHHLTETLCFLANQCFSPSRSNQCLQNNNMHKRKAHPLELYIYYIILKEVLPQI